jgi:hypothetical protein
VDCEDAMDYMVTRGCEGHMGCQGTTDNEDAKDCEDAVDDEGVDTKDTKDAMDSQVATDHMDAKDCEDAATMYTLCGGGGRAAACDVAPVAPAGQRQRWTPMPATCASVRVTVHYIDAYTVTQCPVPFPCLRPCPPWASSRPLREPCPFARTCPPQVGRPTDHEDPAELRSPAPVLPNGPFLCPLPVRRPSPPCALPLRAAPSSPSDVAAT